MLSVQKIQDALHASRVVPVGVANPHGPIGLEQLAQLVAQIQHGIGSDKKIVRPLEVPLETWLKLEKLAEAATKDAARPVSVSDVAVAILQSFVTSNP